MVFFFFYKENTFPSFDSLICEFCIVFSIFFFACSGIVRWKRDILSSFSYFLFCNDLCHEALHLSEVRIFQSIVGRMKASRRTWPCPNFRKLRRWLYWEKSFCRCHRVNGLKIRSSWITQTVPKSSDEYSSKRPKGRRRGRPSAGGGRDWNLRALSPGGLEPPEAERSKEGFFPGTGGGGMAQQTPWFQTSSVWNWERRRSSRCKPPDAAIRHGQL